MCRHSGCLLSLCICCFFIVPPAPALTLLSPVPLGGGWELRFWWIYGVHQSILIHDVYYEITPGGTICSKRFLTGAAFAPTGIALVEMEYLQSLLVREA